LPDAIPINSHTDSDQTAARAVMAADGSFVVTWYSKEDPTQSRIWARLFDADGVPLAEEFQVSQSPVGNQFSPAIAGFGTGDFVTVWESPFEDGSQSGIYGRRYAGGVPASDEFLINTSETAGNQRTPAVAAAPDGRFVVVWETDHIDATAADIVGQL